MFLPIMRGTLHLPAARDPEILERLDPTPLYKLCLRCQTHLHDSATTVTEEQAQLVVKIKEVSSRFRLRVISCEPKYLLTRFLSKDDFR
jgi:hypothetical protein